MRLAIGIDLGGTKIAAALVGPDGSTRDARRVPTPRNPDEVLAAMAQLAVELAERCDAPPVGVGVGTGGVVDPERGVVVEASEVISGWSGVALASRLTEATGLGPVRVDNDGNTFARAELRWGSARGLTDALFVAVGTGIGGAVLLDGALRYGGRWAAGEFGQVPMRGAGRGQTTLEDVGCGPALVRAYVAATGRPVVDLRDVAEDAEMGGVAAIRVIRDGATQVGWALGGIAVALGVDVLVVGGGVADIGPRYLDALAEAARSCVPRGALSIRAASQGSLSSIAGAASLVLP